MRTRSPVYHIYVILSVLALCLPITRVQGQCITLELDFCKNWNGLRTSAIFEETFRKADLAEATKWCNNPILALEECVPPAAIAYSCILAIREVFDRIVGDDICDVEFGTKNRNPPHSADNPVGLCKDRCDDVASLQTQARCGILPNISQSTPTPTAAATAAVSPATTGGTGGTGTGSGVRLLESTQITDSRHGIAPQSHSSALRTKQVFDYVIPQKVECAGYPSEPCFTGVDIKCPLERPFIFAPRPATPTPDIFDPTKDDFEGAGTEDELPWYRSQLQGSYIVAGLILAMTITVIGCCIYRNKTKQKRAEKRKAKEEERRRKKEEEEFQRAAAFRAQEQFWAMNVSAANTGNFDADFTSAIGGRDHAWEDEEDRGIMGNIVHEVTHFFDEDHHVTRDRREIRAHKSRMDVQRDEVRDAAAAHAAAQAFYKAKAEKEAKGLELTEEDIIQLQEEISKEQGLVMRDPEEKADAVKSMKEAKAERARKRGEKDCTIL